MIFLTVTNSLKNLITFFSVDFRQLGCFSTAEGNLFLFTAFLFRNLRRLVHAMILKGPSGDWMPGLLRLQCVLFLRICACYFADLCE